MKLSLKKWMRKREEEREEGKKKIHTVREVEVAEQVKVIHDLFVHRKEEKGEEERQKNDHSAEEGGGNVN